MTLVKFAAFNAGLRYLSGRSVNSIKDVSGTASYYGNAGTAYMMFPFYGETAQTNVSGLNSVGDYCFVASDNSNVQPTEYAVPNTIGTVTVTSKSATGKGATYVLTVSGTQGDTITSLYFIKRVYNSANYQKNWLIYALVLDSPVTIDSTGTANFTFAIEF